MACPAWTELCPHLSLRAGCERAGGPAGEGPSADRAVGAPLPVRRAAVLGVRAGHRRASEPTHVRRAVRSAAVCCLGAVRRAWGARVIVCGTKILLCRLLYCLQRMCVTFLCSLTPPVVLGAAACPVLSKWSSTEHISDACAVPPSSAFRSQVQHYTLGADGKSYCSVLPDCLIIVFRIAQSWQRCFDGASASVQGRE